MNAMNAMNAIRVLLCVVVFILIGIGAWFIVKSKASAPLKPIEPVRYYRITDKLKYKRSSMQPMQPILDLGKSYPLVKTNHYKLCNFLMFESLNEIDNLLVDLQVTPSLKFIYGLAGSDTIASKSELARQLKKHYGVAASGSMMPVTYVIEGGEDADLFDAQYDSKKMYILKKNIQRQEGFKITSDKAEIMAAFRNSSRDIHNNFVVCQELLQDPLLVGGRKINIRIYMLVVSRPGGIVDIYTYKDGFMYYTPEMFRAGLYSIESNITTGYIDRKVYVDNPLTYQDLLAHLGSSAEVLDRNINRLLGQVAQAYAPVFRDANASGSDAVRFLIYGCDIAPDDAFGAKIIEVNKGPDLSYKDERDKALKLGMFEDALVIAGVIGVIGRKPSYVSGFRKHT